jgi:hypothetical protein
MTTITTRSAQGSALTHSEMDDNLTNLNTSKIESVSLTDLSITASTTEMNLLDMSTSGSSTGDVLTSAGVGSAPTWSAITIPSGADYVSDWVDLPATDSNHTFTHGLGTQDLTYTLLLKFPDGDVTIINPMLTYPYSDVSKPSGVSVMITTTQFKCRLGRGVGMWRKQADSETGHGFSFLSYSSSRDSFELRILGYKY